MLYLGFSVLSLRLSPYSLFLSEILFEYYSESQILLMSSLRLDRQRSGRSDERLGTNLER